MAYPQKGNTIHEAEESLRLFTMDWGIPKNLTVDGAPENVGSKTEFMKQIRQYDIILHVSLPSRLNENPAEGVIREVHKEWFHVIAAEKVPNQLWNYG
jgi:predicted SpoU family rRNA methylase